MAILHFSFPTPAQAAAVARNMVSSVNLWATGAAVNAVKSSLYSAKMGSEIEELSADEKLQLPDQPTTIFNQEDRNAIRLRGESGIAAIFQGVKIEVQRNNTIVSTALVGRKGTVKEFIQAQDYKVTISGVLTNHSVYRDASAANVDNIGAITERAKNSKSYPIEQLRILINILESEESVECESILLEQYGISKLALASLYIKPSPHINTQPFKLQFLSDEDVDLYDIEDV